ncbi:hypothetical protein HanRHA438_Chr15g0703941 [Helianthus annuus]|nr:hypothetical protein HanRHA438_Chr15g0703941 [Helianthus annuus]
MFDCDIGVIRFHWVLRICLCFNSSNRVRIFSNSHRYLPFHFYDRFAPCYWVAIAVFNRDKRTNYFGDHGGIGRVVNCVL